MNTTVAGRVMRGLALGGMLALAAACRDPAPRAMLETESLQRKIDSRAAAGAAWKGAKPGLERLLAQARQSLRAGRLYLGLEELGQAEVAYRAVESSAGGGERLRGEWQTELWSVEVHWPWSSRAGAWDRAPAAIRALSETAQTRATTLLAASGSYTAVTNPAAGLYYLGEARGSADFASLCDRLGASRHGTAVPLRSVRPELRRLQELTTAAFQPPRSIQLHGAFITLNATLKLAAELDEACHYAGAWYQYLDGVEQFGMLEAAPQASQPWRDRIAGLHARLASSGRDDSIGELFLERAAALLEAGAGEGSADARPGQERRRRVGIILDRVLPAYAAMLAPIPAEALPAAAAVTVTLVRWPYT